MSEFGNETPPTNQRRVPAIRVYVCEEIAARFFRKHSKTESLGNNLYVIRECIETHPLT